MHFKSYETTDENKKYLRNLPKEATFTFNNKTIRFVHPKAESAANLVLIKAVKNGRPFLKISEPLYVYDKSVNYRKHHQYMSN